MKNLHFKCLLLACAVVVFASCGESGASASEPQADEIKPADGAHNSRNSLDYAGTYRGVTPCADCEGIEVELTISSDNNYTLSTKYLGKGDDSPNITTGTFTWAEDGNSIELSGISDGPSKYKVGEGRLWQLDMEGNVIEGELADKYILTKAN